MAWPEVQSPIIREMIYCIYYTLMICHDFSASNEPILVIFKQQLLFLHILFHHITEIITLIIEAVLTSKSADCKTHLFKSYYNC